MTVVETHQEPKITFNREKEEMLRKFTFDGMGEFLRRKENPTVLFREDLENFVENFNNSRNSDGQDRLNLEEFSNYFNNNFGDQTTRLGHSVLGLFKKTGIALERYNKGYEIVFLENGTDGRDKNLFSDAETAFLEYLGRFGGMNLSECITFGKRENIELDFSGAMINRFLYLGDVVWDDESGKFKRPE